MSKLLDDHREVCGWVAAELRRHGIMSTGSSSVGTAETVSAVWGALPMSSTAELPRAGILPYRLGHVPCLRHRLPVHWIVEEMAGVAEHDQRHQRDFVLGRPGSIGTCMTAGQVRPKLESWSIIADRVEQHGDGCLGASATPTAVSPKPDIEPSDRAACSAIPTINWPGLGRDAINGRRAKKRRGRSSRCGPCRQTQKAVPKPLKETRATLDDVESTWRDSTTARLARTHQGRSMARTRCASTGPRGARTHRRRSSAG